MKYTPYQLYRLFVHDIIRDIRLSQRKIIQGMNREEESTYIEKCTKDIKTLYINRHTNNKINKNGFPTCLLRPTVF